MAKKTSPKPPRRPSISVLLLDRLAASPDGMRFTELQRFAFSLRLGFAHPERPMPGGWWCTQLCGSVFAHVGLLATFAIKGTDGRWRRNSTPHGGKPWAVVERTPRGYHAMMGPKY